MNESLTTAQVDMQSVAVERGEVIYEAGVEGMSWRVVSGTVRLDQPGPDGFQFAGMAVTGDVIGAETLLFGRYTFCARALSACVLEPWMADQAQQPSGPLLLSMLAATERRMADVLALRSGKAGDRIRRLFEFMTGGLVRGRKAAQLALPRLKDIAEITDLSVETVSRTISHLGADGTLDVTGRYRARHVSADSLAAPRT